MTSFKTTIRRLASFAFAITLTATMAISVSAKNYDDIGANYKYAEQVDILSDIGIIVGTSTNEFSPDQNVTREQMALLLFRTMLGRSNSGAVNTTAFTDLQNSTYFGAISWANAAGFIIGTSDTTFSPVGGITLQDAMTMIVRALGQSNSAMDRGYPWTYINAAIRIGLDKGLNNISYDKTLTRGETAAMIYNALTAEYLVPKAGTSVISTTIIENVFGYDFDNCTVVATNKYTIENYANVVKTGYITVKKSDDSSMTINFSELGLNGAAENWLGKNVNLIYKADSKTKLVTVFGASYTGVSKTFESAEIGANNSYIAIDGVRYNVVDTKSGTLNTNENELNVYYYNKIDGKLTKLISNAEVAAALNPGIFKIELITDNAGANVADRAILKSLSFGKFTATNGKIDIAGGLTETELTGGISNTANAQYGDYVLYYYNAQNKSLEIAEKLTATVSATVTRLTATTATIGGVEYKLAFAPVGSLNIGTTASVIAKNGYILAVVGAPAVTTESKYLVTTSASIPVYVGGYVRYTAIANIGGVSQNILTNQTVVTDTVYRYTVDANGIYILYAPDDASFTQNGDTSYKFIKNTVTQTFSMTSLPYYSIDINFVTDKDTVIIVRNNGIYTIKTGVYTAGITINAGSKFTAVFSNNFGDVKTLKYMYISDGALDFTNATQTYVKILSNNGTEYINNTVYTIYTALDIRTGVISTYKSVYSTLAAGSVYALDVAGNVLDIKNDNLLTSGAFNGFTASTITIGTTTYRLASNVSVIHVNADNTTTALTISGIYNSTSPVPVTYYAVNGEVVLIIA